MPPKNYKPFKSVKMYETVTHINAAIAACDNLINSYENNNNSQTRILVSQAKSEKRAFLAVLQSLRGNHRSLKSYTE